MFFSIIIPVKEINDYIREAVPKILDLEYDNFEIIILPNEDNIPFEAEKTRIIASGNVGPAQKRNLWAERSNWRILAFLDDDAYPRKDRLWNALKEFETKNIVWIGWPGLTIDTDPFWAQVSGAVFLTKIWWGNPDRYFPWKGQYFIDDWPSVNLMILKDSFFEVWWFDNDYWPWEDTKLCEDISYKLKRKILYSPNIVVWHHRRPNIKKHLNQIWSYWLHRWFFAKSWNNNNNNRLFYFVPSAFLIFLIVFWTLSFFNSQINILFLIWISIYLLALVVAFFDITIKNKRPIVSLAALPLIFLSHITYWYNFIKWFVFTKNLKSKFR